MNQTQINFLTSLDPYGMNGTIQAVLLRNDLDKLDYIKSLEFLLSNTVGEKSVILKENSKLIKFIKDNGLDTSEVEV